MFPTEPDQRIRLCVDTTGTGVDRRRRDVDNVAASSMSGLDTVGCVCSLLRGLLPGLANNNDGDGTKC